MGMFAEFKTFIKRGNVMDLAVGVIIGAAFGKIVSSVTDDLIMPVLSLFTGKSAVDFTNWFVALDGNTYPTIAKAKEAGAATLHYGNFITTVINFLIVAFVIFILVKQVNRLIPSPPPPPPPGPAPEQTLLTEIRDLLARR